MELQYTLKSHLREKCNIKAHEIIENDPIICTLEFTSVKVFSNVARIINVLCISFIETRYLSVHTFQYDKSYMVIPTIRIKRAHKRVRRKRSYSHIVCLSEIFVKM